MSSKKKPSSDQQYLVLVATTTPEKVEIYNNVAINLGLPIQFRRLTEIADAFHSAEENSGDRRGNAHQKAEAIDDVVALCRMPGTPHNRILKEKCEAWGVNFDPKYIHYATEDSTFNVPELVWPILRDKLALHVDEELLKSADKNGKVAGPNAETGPILAAVGMTRFFNLLREAALEAGLQESIEVPVIQHVTMVLTGHADSPAKPATFLEGEAYTYLFARNGLREVIKKPHARIAQSSHFLCALDRQDTPLADYWDEYVSTKSERARLITSQLLPYLQAAAGEEVSTSMRRAAEDTTEPCSKRQFKRHAIVQPIVAPVPGFGNVSIFYGRASGNADPYQAINMAPALQEADALIFPSFDASNIAQRRQNYRKLTSAIVAKMLESRNMNMPIVVMDNGCWTPILDWCFNMTSQGMMKDYPRRSIETGNHVQHIATSYLDILRGGTMGEKEKAARNLLRHRFASYHRYKSPGTLGDSWEKGGAAKSDGMFATAVCISASSDNLELIQDARAYGAALARDGDGLVWGAGDRHGMGAVYDGYRAAGGPWVAGISTPTILLSETKFGRMPNSAYWEICPDIYRRMISIFSHSNEIVHMPGGAGTTEEGLVSIILKEEGFPMMQDKNIVFYSPDLHRKSAYHDQPFWNGFLSAAMDEDFQYRIMRNHHAYTHQGYWLATELDELIDIHRHLKMASKLKNTFLAQPVIHAPHGVRPEGGILRLPAAQGARLPDSQPR